MGEPVGIEPAHLPVISRPLGSGSRSTALFSLLAITNLISAGLVFTIQPLIGKLALPDFGGSAMVWNTALMVFQGGLLLAYLYAHLLCRLRSSRGQVIVHGTVAIVSLLALPIAFDPVAKGLNPSFALTASLIASIGLPYFVVCATSPLTQRWYHQWTRGHGRDPYLLYSASNVGSLLALLSYPFLIEPLYDTNVQRTAWSFSYVVLLVALLAFMVMRRRGAGSMDANPAELPMPTAPGHERLQKTDYRQRLRWVVLAFVPSLYLMGVTLHIGIDIAAAPFVWVLPLALYLLSFVLVFANRSWSTHPALLATHACAVIALSIYFYYTDLIFLLALHLLGLFLTCMVCHGRLVAERPPAANLTEFYIWMAFGGWLGGVVGSLVAPAFFDANWEYLLAIAAACLLRPTQKPGSRRADLLAPAGLAVLLLVLRELNLPIDLKSYLVFGSFVVAVYVFRSRPLRFALGIVPLLAGYQVFESERLLLRERSFYGIYEVGVDESGSLKELMHGTTLHGAQAIDPELHVLPLQYYNPEGPLGQVMSAMRNAGSLEKVGIVGLGVGTIACYALPRTRMTFYEIDPLVVRLARTQFSYLDRCAPDAEIVVGDGRLSLENTNERYDVLVIDAFSSDSIPIHLLTVEAMELYLGRLKPGGVLLYHISNRYVDLSTVLARGAAACGASAYLQAYEPTGPELRRGAAASEWMLITQQGALGDAAGKWNVINADGGAPPWTDRYSNLLDAIDWERVLLF